MLYLPRKQPPPSAFSRSHKAEAISLSPKPAIRKRYQVPFVAEIGFLDIRPIALQQGGMLAAIGAPGRVGFRAES